MANAMLEKWTPAAYDVENPMQRLPAPFPVITTWDDPMQYRCQRNALLGIGDAERDLRGKIAIVENACDALGLKSTMCLPIPADSFARLAFEGLDGWRTRFLDLQKTHDVLVLSRSESAFARDVKLYDSTIGPRFSNPRLVKRFGDEQMPQTADNLAREYEIKREEADRFAVEKANKDLETAKTKLHVLDEFTHHRQGHVGLQQGHAHFPQHVLDVAFGDARLPAHGLDQARHAVGEGGGHAGWRARGRRAP